MKKLVIDDGPHRAKDANGNETIAYERWRSMHRRCYSEEWVAKNPSYHGCFVCVDWHSFQRFADWFYRMGGNQAENIQLDKDILFPGNKEYCPEKCCLVSGALNSFLTNSSRSKNGNFVGATYDQRDKKFTPMV